MHASNALLTTDERLQLTTAISFDAGDYRGRGRQHHSFKVLVDALALARLIDNAASGNRIYELMALRRPGDIIHYLWVTPEAIGPEVAELVQVAHQRAPQSPGMNMDEAAGAPLQTFDSLFYWQGDDTETFAENWLRHRTRECWSELLLGLLAIVREAQNRLRCAGDFLSKREIELIDENRHRRDYWPEAARVMSRAGPASRQESLSPELLQTILQLALHTNVRSVSCPFDEPALWRALSEIQLRRADELGVAPQQALRLSGPDSGLDGIAPEDWAGEIHIPYEGAAPGDLFIQPDWRELRLDADHADGSLTQVNGGTPCHFLLAEKDFGELACATRRFVDGWVLYESKSPYRPAYIEHWQA